MPGRRGSPLDLTALLGGKLRDDATVLCFDWHGGPPQDRHTSAGADV